MLPRIPEWHIALVGTLKAGALAIPSSTILRPKDIAYRARHSEAVAIVSIDEQTDAVDAVRAEMPSVKHTIVCTRDSGGLNIGSTRGGVGRRQHSRRVRRSRYSRQASAAERLGMDRSANFARSLLRRRFRGSSNARFGSGARLLHLWNHRTAKGRPPQSRLHQRTATYRAALARGSRR